MTSEEAIIFHEQFESENGIKSDVHHSILREFPTIYLHIKGEQVSNKVLRERGYKFVIKPIVIEEIKFEENLNLPKSKLTVDQVKTVEKKNLETKNHGKVDAYLTLRYDDKSNDGYNLFSINVQAYQPVKNKSYKDLVTAAEFYQFIKYYFPEYQYVAKWNACSSNGPRHYLTDTLYWIDSRNKKGWTEEKNREYLERARYCARWPNAKVEDLLSEKKLVRRLPAIMRGFKKDMESLGFVY